MQMHSLIGFNIKLTGVNCKCVNFTLRMVQIKSDSEYLVSYTSFSRRSLWE